MSIRRPTLWCCRSTKRARSKRSTAEHNAKPKPFLWTKSAEAILAKLNRLPVLSV
jgi:hypothetical protein